MKIIKKILDFCCVVLIGSLLMAVIGLLVLDLASDGRSAPGNIESVVKIMIQLCVIVSIISATALCLYAVIELWSTRDDRPLLTNIFYFFLVIGFSWLAGLLIYQKTKYKLIKTESGDK